MITTTLARRVAQIAAEIPNNIAIREGEAILTYSQLLAAADALATTLNARGDVTGRIICVEASSARHMLVAQIAIGLVGAAYLPMAGTLPGERRNQLLRSALPAAVIDERVDGTQRVHFFEGRERTRLVDPALYVLFTSGSTGSPKAVVVGEEGVERITNWRRDASQIARGESVGSLAEFTFDVFVYESWSALLLGATMVRFEQSDILDTDRLVQLLTKLAVVDTWVPTSLVADLMMADWSGTRIRQMLTGGDRLVARPPASLPFRLVNAYGPTEATVFVTAGEVQPHGDDPPHIGKELPGVLTEIRDSAGIPVISGRGELFLGGSSIAFGYLAPDERVAFRVDEYGTRWYATGDVVERGLDGNLKFIGRIDRQVQLDGRRVEPDEIAQVLRSHGSISDAFVCVGFTASGVRRLAAIVVSESALRTSEVQQFVGDRLPRHMIPNRILTRASLPTTSTGKVDIAAALAMLDLVANPL